MSRDVEGKRRQHFAISLADMPRRSAGAVAFGVVVGVVGSMCVREAAPGDVAAKAWTGRRAGLIAGAGVAGGWLVLAGLAVLLGSAGGVLLLPLLVCTVAAWLWCPPEHGGALRVNPWRVVQDRLLRAAQRTDPPRPVVAPSRAAPPFAAAGPLAPSLVPAKLSTPQLCLAWQRTFFALLDLPAGAPRAEIVHLRERLLDEIERRDPEGFTRWLETGARAGGDPGRYHAGDR